MDTVAKAAGAKAIAKKCLELLDNVASLTIPTGSRGRESAFSSGAPQWGHLLTLNRSNGNSEDIMFRSTTNFPH